MQNLSATESAVTTVQNPSLSELHMVKAKHSKKASAAEDRNQSSHKPFTVWSNTFTPKEGVSDKRCRMLQIWEDRTFQGELQGKGGKGEEQIWRYEKDSEIGKSP